MAWGRDRTVLGRVIVSRNILRIETNSERRADALRSRVREACGSILNDSTRKTEDLSSTISASRRPGKPLPAKSPGEADLIRKLKAAHYRDWVDIPLPALGGKTPRAAALSPRLRKELDLLLREIENHENHLAEAERFDFGPLRRELGFKE